MGFLSSFVASWKKSSRLRRVSLLLGKSSTPRGLGEFGKEFAESEAAEDDLIKLIEADLSLSKITAIYGATSDDLRNIYRTLVRMGAGQWQRGHWVPASALAFGTTLPFLLEETKNGRIDNYDTWLEVSFRVLDYFERGQVTPLRVN